MNVRSAAWPTTSLPNIRKPPSSANSSTQPSKSPLSVRWQYSAMVKRIFSSEVIDITHAGSAAELVLGDAFELFLAAELVVAVDGRAPHLAAHADRRAGSAMQEPPVVPQHHLARHPFVEIGALGPRDVRDDFAQEGVAFWILHPLDAVGEPGRDVDHLAPGLFLDIDHRVDHARTGRVAHRLRLEIAEADATVRL